MGDLATRTTAAPEQTVSARNQVLPAKTPARLRADLTRIYHTFYVLH
jgi:hypothetical protein